MQELYSDLSFRQYFLTEYREQLNVAQEDGTELRQSTRFLGMHCAWHLKKMHLKHEIRH